MKFEINCEEGARIVWCLNKATDEMRATGCTTNPFIGFEPFAAKENMRGFKGYLAECLADVRDGCVVEFTVPHVDARQVLQAIYWTTNYRTSTTAEVRSILIRLTSKLRGFDVANQVVTLRIQ